MKKIYLLFIVFIVFYGHSQNQAANWYFGENAGINFNTLTGEVTPLTDGNLYTREGCTSISDENGNLLFYTDGSTVFNKNHDIMLNGTGLIGDFSSTQSAIIVPKPQNPTIYYIFTVDEQITQNNPVNRGLNYSEVDMSLDGGLGAITNKNINLVDECSEKVTAVLKDCVTETFWVVTFANQNGTGFPFNTFFAFEVDATGINTTPVKSTFITLNSYDGRGYLKLSPDGTKMACAIASENLHLFDFDTATGKFTNDILLKTASGNYNPYGIEFSPNSEMLYITYSNDFFGSGSENPANHTSILAQYYLKAPIIRDSEVIIDNRQLYRGALQLGPNGKIYRALSATYEQGLPFLGVIENPNVQGLLCNYVHNAIDLSPANSSQGLPPFVSSFFNTQIDIIKNGSSSSNLTLCDGENYKLESLEIPGATYQWYRDETLIPETDFDLDISQPGKYQVYIEPNNGECAIEGHAFVSFLPNPTAVNTTLLQCDEDGTPDGLTTFNLNEAYNNIVNNEPDRSAIFYSDASRTVEITPESFNNTSNPQTIYVEVFNDDTGCSSYCELTLSVSVTNVNDVNFPAACDDDGSEDGFHSFNLNEADSLVLAGHQPNLELSYYETYDDALLEVNPLNSNYINTIPYSQIIFARVENDNNCYGISKVQLTVNKLPEIDTEEITNYCLNFHPDTIPINAGILEGTPNEYTYSWSTGETTFIININQAQNYTVTVTNENGCSKSRTVTVSPSNVAQFEKIEVQDVSENNTITVFVTGNGEYEYQLIDSENNLIIPYQTSPVFENVAPGIYTVYVQDTKNDCGEVSDLVSVIGFPKYFTPNNDGINDTWQITGVNNMFQPNTKVLIFDRYGKLLIELNPTGEGWNGKYKGKTLPADDYWFAVTLQDGRVFKNHFSLKK